MKQPSRWPRRARLDWTFPPPYPKGHKGIKSNKLERGAFKRSMDKMTCYPSVSPAQHSGTKDRGLPTRWRQFRPPGVDSSGLQQKAASAYENQTNRAKQLLAKYDYQSINNMASIMVLAAGSKSSTSNEERTTSIFRRLSKEQIPSVL